MPLNFHLRLAHKIAAIGVIAVLGLLAVGAIYYFGITAQSLHRQTAADARAVAGRNTKLAVLLLESRRTEKDFLLRGNEAYAKRHAALTTEVLKDLADLRQQALGWPETERKIDEVATGFTAYSGAFVQVVASKINLGLTEEAGLEGSLRKSVHDIETALKKVDEPRLAVIMLMMRRHEKDFMLRRAAKYGEEMKARAAEFSVALEAADKVPASVKAELATKLAAYQQGFFAWMQTANELGAQLKATSDAYAKIEPVLAAVDKEVAQALATAEQRDEATRADTTLLMQIVIALATVSVACLVLLIGRAIARPLSAMTEAMRELAQGNFQVVLPGLARNDEIGDMGRAVDQFKQKAVERAEREAKEKAADATRHAQERRAEMHRLADSFEQAIGGIVGAVSSASSQLEMAAATLSRNAEHTQQLSCTVAAASEQASANVKSVASASEEMTSSVGEIGRQVQESANIADVAVTQAHATDARINDLSTAPSRIGDVVKLITAIAE